MLNRLMRIAFLKRLYILFTYLSSVIPDSIYLKMIYRIRTGQKLNLAHPVTFNEKIQWLKLNDQRREYSVMVDKYGVRDYIKNKLPDGEKYLIPLLGVYGNANDIDLNELPEQFVLKCTHDSGSVILCNRKTDFNKKMRKQINAALKRKFYYSNRELAYKTVKPRIIIEKMMKEESGGGLIDYKFYCFHGEPKYLYVSAGLENHATARISFYNLDLSEAPFQRKDFKHFEKIPKVPLHYDEMIEIARILSQNIPFVRIDLYEINNQIYFSEITLTPCGGMMPFEPKEYDKILGENIILDNI